MTEIKSLDGKVLFSFDENETTLAKEIGWYKNLAFADLRGADLRGANLENADLEGVNIRGANLEGADLRWSYLECADLEDAELCGANLGCANFKNADLKGANIKEAKLIGANLFGAHLMGANLESADLYKANLFGAHLMGANLAGADLSGVDLRYANLENADLSNAKLENADIDEANIEDAKNVPDMPLACPSEGSFVAWKKVGCRFLVKLEIPTDAKRSSATSNKCRCDKALVLDIEDLATGEHPKGVVNHNYCKCVYKVGKMVYPDSFDEDRWNECSHGIHFFMDKQDALDY